MLSGSTRVVEPTPRVLRVSAIEFRWVNILAAADSRLPSRWPCICAVIARLVIIGFLLLGEVLDNELSVHELFSQFLISRVCCYLWCLAAAAER